MHDHYDRTDISDGEDIEREVLLISSPHVRLAEKLLPSSYQAPVSFRPHDAKGKCEATLPTKAPDGVLYDSGGWINGGYFIPSSLWSQSRKKVACLIIMLVSLASISLVVSGAAVCRGSVLGVPFGRSDDTSASIQKSWGAYSPYYSANAYTPPPNNCQITQVSHTVAVDCRN